MSKFQAFSVALLAGAVLAGCGPAAADQDTGSGSRAAASGTTPPKALTTKEVTVDGKKLEVEIYSLRRSGGLVVLEFGARNPATKDDGSEEAGVRLGGPFGVGDRDDASGVALVDDEGKKKYLPALYDDECLCSKNLYALAARPGKTTYLTASYAEVPTDISSVNVQFAALGTVDNVAVK